MGLIRAEQSDSHHSSPAMGLPFWSMMTPAPFVRPEDQSSLRSASNTSKWMKARRIPTPEGSLWPVRLTTVTRALRAPPSALTSLTLIVAVRFSACSVISRSPDTIESTPMFESMGSSPRMPRMSGKFDPIFHEEHVQTHQRMLCKSGAHRQIEVLRRQHVLGLREVTVLLDGGNLAAIGTALRVLVRHVAVLARLRLRAGPGGQRTVGRHAGTEGAERPFRIGRLLVNSPDRPLALQNGKM